MTDDRDELRALRGAVEKLAARVDRVEQELTVARTAIPASKSAPSRIGITAVNRIGALTVAIGLIFFFKYAVDENLIRAGAGVLLGIVFGLLLLAAGDWLHSHEQRIFAQGIAGCGLAALYISIYAAFAFYKLIPEAAGFVALVAVSALALGLSIRYLSAVIATLGFIGAFLTPMLLGDVRSEAWLQFVYLLLVNVTSVSITIRQRWAVVVSIAGPLSVLAAWSLFEPKHAHLFAIYCLCLGAGHLAAAVGTRQSRTVGNALYLVGHGGVIAAALRAIGFMVEEKSAGHEFASVLLALYGIAALTYGIARRSNVDRRLGLVLLAMVIAKLYAWDVWSLERLYRISAFLGLGVLLLVASYIYSRSDRKPEGSS